jgi:hypothetical protein
MGPENNLKSIGLTLKARVETNIPFMNDKDLLIVNNGSSAPLTVKVRYKDEPSRFHHIKILQSFTISITDCTDVFLTCDIDLNITYALVDLL